MNYRNQRQSGFTLVEIAIVLVIIGLLLGGILKGQELINSARVRNMADMNSGIQAAYYGFIDRYRAVPGDMSAVAASEAIGVPITGGGNRNGRIDHVVGPWTEPNALWEHLSKAGFIQGAYAGDDAEPLVTLTLELAPLNVFNSVVTMGRTLDYQERDAGGAAQNATAARLHLVMGRNTPVSIMRELDLKVDDGFPVTGVMRVTPQGTATTFAGTNSWGASGDDCNVFGTQSQEIYDVTGDWQDCNAVFLY